MAPPTRRGGTAGEATPHDYGPIVGRSNFGIVLGPVRITLVPFVPCWPLLLAALSGHVLAVMGAAGLSLWYLERDGGG